MHGSRSIWYLKDSIINNGDNDDDDDDNNDNDDEDEYSNNLDNFEVLML